LQILSSADLELLSLYIPAVGLPAYLRYAGLGVLSYKLHVIGRELLARQCARGKTLTLAT